MENILELGGEAFKVVANFRMSYNLTKYRNKISTGFDFSKADKKVVAEILTVTKDPSFDLTTLSDKALSFLQQKNSNDLFNADEIVDIVKILTGLQDESKIEELLDKEVAENGYDMILNKLIGSVNLVFTNAKDISDKKVINKMELVKVAEK